MHEDALLPYLAAAEVRGWGAGRLAALTREFGSLSAAIEAARGRGAAPTWVPSTLFRDLPRRLDLAAAARRLHAARAAGLEVLTWESQAYPPSLWQAPAAPPPVLYLQGRILPAVLLPYPDLCSVAIVGTRRASARGMAFARSLASGLAAAGVTVVSGLALGIDTAAHEGALLGAGPTVAVLGSGHGHLHPPSNRGLADRILAQGGGILSEYPPDTPPAPFTFPHRNRLISGLARVVAVVEAGARSGASITVGHALEQGREVYAAPGRPGDPTVAGTLAMLRDGAHVLAGVDDLLETFPELTREAGVRQPRLLHPPASSEIVASADSPLPDAPSHIAEPLHLAEPAPDALLRAFEELDEPSLERLAQHTKLPIAALLGRLTALELRGLIARTESGGYRVAHRRPPTG